MKRWLAQSSAVVARLMLVPLIGGMLAMSGCIAGPPAPRTEAGVPESRMPVGAAG